MLDGATKATIKTSDSTEFEIKEIVASSKSKDIVKFTVKKAEDDNFDFLELTESDVEQGDVVYCISSPLGLEYTVSNGIISCLREDSHGKIAQITAPVSSGSSGSALLNDKGEVFAVTTFLRTGGQNLNFGVRLDKKLLAEINENDFEKNNPKFNKKNNFIILNIPSDKDKNLVLNALEFRDDATIAYMSFTNLDMSQPEQLIWCSVSKENKGMYIQDMESNRKYYVTSSTIGSDKNSASEVSLASTKRFKVFFPAIRNFDLMNSIDLIEGEDGQGWCFTDIALDKYRNKELRYDMKNYNKDYAYSIMHEGSLLQAQSIFIDILNEDREDEQALLGLGLIEHVNGNNLDAEIYFSMAIDAHPNSYTAYLNRYQLRMKQKQFDKALDDINAVINLKQEPKYLKDRALLYIAMGNFSAARVDVQKAFDETDDPELEILLKNMWKYIKDKN